MASAITTSRLPTFSTVRVQRPSAARSASRIARVQPRQMHVARATPTTDKSAVETAIDNARETCEGGSAGECANAWDDVEEISADLAHKRDNKKKSDPLDEYCEDNPDADECRVYED
eukprot:CAMPEP_0206135530 /NCGR_PEP_ID=MMETSP1473-20131121/805_1 /ASSEMBLY_ACC=CAM_ASM_001109 /TAXON_ID=1461547 /ORGANISM="Stichococcus sp, Strain RCC1054" /LENGTH=116 /DNA_ID=CAMNT_0053527445 /DNA_START=65 /DNA_END=415 /DNA_ORIENTATION=+